MALILIIASIVILWTAGMADWVVAYATGLAQLGIWCTLGGLLPFTVLWISLRRQAFVDISTAETRPHWSILLKASLCQSIIRFFL